MNRFHGLSLWWTCNGWDLPLISLYFPLLVMLLLWCDHELDLNWIIKGSRSVGCVLRTCSFRSRLSPQIKLYHSNCAVYIYREKNLNILDLIKRFDSAWLAIPFFHLLRSKTQVNRFKCIVVSFKTKQKHLCNITLRHVKQLSEMQVHPLHYHPH